MAKRDTDLTNSESRLLDIAGLISFAVVILGILIRWPK